MFGALEPKRTDGPLLADEVRARRRLSVQPVKPEEYEIVVRMGKSG
jgi:predicted RNA-binding protein with PUA-like domain